jgi:hypothetical protein
MITSVHTRWVRIFGFKIVYARKRITVRTSHVAGGAW